MFIHVRKKITLYAVLILGLIIIFGICSFPLKNSHADGQTQTVAKPIKIQRGDGLLPQFDPSLPGMQENPIPNESGDKKDLQHAIDTAPDGLQIANLFELGTFHGNNARIINKVNESDKTGSLLQITNNKYQLGSIWSKLDNGNYIDVSKNQTLSMWLYFGNRNSQYKNIGDGMAFVLQNGGTDAISTFHRGQADQRYGYGESLGVWGTDFDPDHIISPQNFASTAIPNSFAIEFDTFSDHASANYIDGKGNNFDNDLPELQHIAMGYPDSSQTYTQKSDINGNNLTKRYFVMNHDSVKANKGLTDGEWHHVTIEYQKLKDNIGNLTYRFDDKDKKGNLNPKPIEASKQIDISHFKLDHGNTKLRWGFTGSTGEYFENNLISFESVPSFVNGKVETSIFDETKKTQIFGIKNEDKNVSSGDKLTFNYELKYLSGIKPWENTCADITIPKDVKVNSIDILYHDKTTESIPIDSSTSGALPNEFNFKLNNALKDHDPVNPDATISVHTTVNQVAEDTNVWPAHARFKSDYLIEDAESPKFTIIMPELNFQLVQPTNNIFANKDSVPKHVKIQYHVWTRNVASNSAIFVWYSVNDKEHFPYFENPKTFQKDEYNTLFVDGSKFKPGENKIYVFAKNMSTQLTTETQSVDFYVLGDGAIKFDAVSPTVSFASITNKSGPAIIRRNKEWTVNVIDNRTIDLNNRKKYEWELQVSATPFIDTVNQNIFNGRMIFKASDGSVIPIGIDPRTIFHEVKTDNQTQKYEITKHWDSTHGILLKQNGPNNDGTYHSILTWSLVDGPK